MAEDATYSTAAIDPSTFDLVVHGTGLSESLLAAAASAAGKSVLHLDPNPFYGSHFSSLSPQSLTSFLHHQNSPSSSPESAPSNSPFEFVGLQSRAVYTDVEIHGEVPEPSRRFLLDISGPRVIYCADPVVDLMLKSGANHHVEFKSLDASLFYWEGRLCTVPDSREGIFKDKTLGLTEKSQMMRFLKLVRGHIASEGGEGGGDGARIDDEDLEIPFAEFLEKMRLPKRIKLIVLYAIVMADYDQDNRENCKRTIKTEEGLKSLALYNSSVGRFPNAVGAFIYPIYGQGELPQAFCRCAAVKGALYVLRMPVAGLLMSKENSQCKGVKLGSGQDILCDQLVMDPTYMVPLPVSTDFPGRGLEDASQVKAGYSDKTTKVARMVCITRRSVQPDLSNVLVVFPPRSLYPKQMTAIRALQLSSNLAVCPPGMFLLYLSTPCENTIQGKEYLRAAYDALSRLPGYDDSDNSTTTDSEAAQETEPTLLWNALYIQEPTQVSANTFFTCPMPDSSLDYRNILETTIKLFREMYPREEFIPESSATENSEEDGGPSD